MSQARTSASKSANIENPSEKSRVKEPSIEASIIDEETLKNKVYEIRGQKVMLDFDLAEIYGYTTKAFNQQVQRNIEKFEEDFMFQLTEKEELLIRSHFVTRSHRNDRYKTRAFTEQGVYMLMTVLKGKLATRQGKALIRLFKRLKDYVTDNQPLLDERDRLVLTTQMTYNTIDIWNLKNELAQVKNQVAAIVDDMGDFVRESEIANVMKNFGDVALRHGFLFMNGHPVKADVFYQKTI